jgi:class 3 adenylate cyclase/tetratricopeptide (TPR) repeat protein
VLLVCSQCGVENPERAKFCLNCAAPLAQATPAREQRKTVTVLFCDVTGSTELGERLDPEALRALLAGYFERMKQIVERHGGTVEKFIGDAVMAVFGVPVVHEDDALRALRAAVEMRQALPELGIQGRIGVTTGEVVTGTEERLATGDAVNVGARLEQAAHPGEILIGEETLQLARDAVEVELVEPLVLKGKADAVRAYRLLWVHGEEGFVRHLEAPMVGRERELDRLRDSFDQAIRDGSCQLFTLLGAAGVGKSRLAAEFLASLADTLVVRGRCLPYGEGITYWPVVEVLKQLPEARTEPVANDAIRALLGDEQLVISREEIAWAFRKRLEAVAVKTPLVCVFDDLHWGEETFLDLVEHIADLSRDAPILLLCMARPELLDRRSGWAGGKLNAVTVLLEPLGLEETELLIESLAHLEQDLRDRILRAAEGNPLFVEEMVALVQESTVSEVIVPPTIQALLAARLDQLGAPERNVLERGAVEGRVFHRGAVQALAPEETHVMARLTSLVRKELVRPDKAQLPGEDAFRFRHLLIRDAAYEALPKATRAELHERFAAWLEEHGVDLVELDEILGYHLEQAYRYSVELGTPDEAVGRRASGRLAAGGLRAFTRGDAAAAAQLLSRTTDLLPSDDPARIALLPDLATALTNAGKLDEAHAVLDEAIARPEGKDRRVELDARIQRLFLTAQLGLEVRFEPLLVEAERLLERVIALDDEGLTARAWHSVGLLRYWLGQAARAEEAYELALTHARAAGDSPQEQLTLLWLAGALQNGPTPVEEALARVLEIAESSDVSVHTSGWARVCAAGLEAMLGRFDRARQLSATAKVQFEEFGLRLELGSEPLQGSGLVELLADDLARAELELRRGVELLEEIGASGYQASVVGLLSEVLYLQGRDEQALESTITVKRLASGDDFDAQARFRAVQAKVLARRNETHEAIRLAEEAIQLTEVTDYLNLRADCHLSLSEVLHQFGRVAEAISAAEEAHRLYEQKGNIVSAARVRALIEDRRQRAPRLG